MPWAVKQFAVECLLAELSSSRSPTEGSSRGVPDVGFGLVRGVRWLTLQRLLCPERSPAQKRSGRQPCPPAPQISMIAF